MRIAMFSDSYLPYVSGVTRAVAVAKKTLIELGHEVTVFCPTYPGSAKEEGIERLLSVKSPNYANYYVALPPFFSLAKKVLRTRPDVIHVHSPFNLCKAGQRIGRRAGIPVVFTYHTMYNMYAHYVPVFGGSVSRVVESTALGMASAVDAVITPSGVIAEYLRSRGVKKPVTPIPNGIDISEFQSGDAGYLREAASLPAGAKIVLTCSRLGLEKNVETLLRSFALSASKVDDAYLVLVGDGPQRSYLEELAGALHVSEKVRFMGTVPPERMPHIYAGADMFLFASITDTQGLVVVEAKAAGLPAVAVGALGVKDMVIDGDDGFLCENDAKKLSDNTIRLLRDNNLLSEMKSAARKNAELFSRQASAQKLIQCYESVMA